MSKYIETDKLKQMVEHKMDMQDFYLPVQFLEVVDDMPAAETKTVRYWHEDLQRAGRPHKVIEVE